MLIATCMKHQPLLNVKSKKETIDLSSADFALRVAKINATFLERFLILYMKYQVLFNMKNKKTVIDLSTPEFTQRVVKVNVFSFKKEKKKILRSKSVKMFCDS